LNLENYTIDEHAHRFAVWASARAAQRGFTTTTNISQAIREIGLQEKIDSFRHKKISASKYDSLHRTLSHDLIRELEASTRKLTSYGGRVAKIIAISIKVFVLLRDVDSDLAKVSHPPIDRILLKNIKEQYSNFSIKSLSWTKFSESEYFAVLEELRKIDAQDCWKIECFWRP